MVPTQYDDVFAALGRRLSFVRQVRLADVPGEVAAVVAAARVAALARVDAGGRP